MAIMDAQLELSDAQALTTTDDSTDVINFTDSDLEMGVGTQLYLNIVVGTAFAGQGSTTITFALVHDADATLTSGATVLYQTPALTETVLVAGYKVLRMPLPANIDEEQYAGLLYTVGSGPMTGGTIDAWIDLGSQSSHDTQVAQS